MLTSTIEKPSLAYARVRAAVAADPLTDTETLTDLSRDTDGCVRLAVAANPHTPLYVLEEMLASEGEDQKFWLSFSLSTTPAALGILARDSSSRVRGRIASHPYATSETLNHLSWDSSRTIRLSVAHHANTSFEALERLRADFDSEVAAVAHEALVYRVSQVR